MNGGYTEKLRDCWPDDGMESTGKKMIGLARASFGDPFGLPIIRWSACRGYEAVAFCNWLTERLKQPTPGPSQEGECDSGCRRKRNGKYAARGPEK